MGIGYALVARTDDFPFKVRLGPLTCPFILLEKVEQRNEKMVWQSKPATTSFPPSALLAFSQQCARVPMAPHITACSVCNVL